MRIGVTYPQTEIEADSEAVRHFGRAVEQIGYTHIFVRSCARRQPSLASEPHAALWIGIPVPRAAGAVHLPRGSDERA